MHYRSRMDGVCIYPLHRLHPFIPRYGNMTCRYYFSAAIILSIAPATSTGFVALR